jgi:2-polyprenyl-3-methyl-5-hydroxy-6-metoxy-1,4-benzoquinol methylase
MRKNQWWSEKYGFFGKHYLGGDNSRDGYLAVKKQTLEERTATEVAGIIRLLDLKEKQKILDVPSGYGRHSIELAKKGLIITGSELNSVHLNKAKQKAKKENLAIKFVKENMIDIKYDREFDAVINVFYSFGFFETDN